MLTPAVNPIPENQAELDDGIIENYTIRVVKAPPFPLSVWKIWKDRISSWKTQDVDGVE